MCIRDRDKFQKTVECDHPGLFERILYTDTSVKMSGANGGVIEAKQKVCIPVKLDLNEWAATSFVIADLGAKNIPFLFALPQVLNLDAVFDTTANREFLISRRTGYAYKLRKPKSHLLFDLLNPPMTKLNDMPPRISIGSNWTYDNWKGNSTSGKSQKGFSLGANRNPKIFLINLKPQGHLSNIARRGKWKIKKKPPKRKLKNFLDFFPWSLRLS